MRTHRPATGAAEKQCSPPNGAAAVSTDNNTLTITTAVGNEANSAFFNAPAEYQNFTANFTYTDVSKNGADGFTFVLQNTGITAIGSGGGGLGF